MLGIVVIDERGVLWINRLVGKSALLDSAMRVVGNDYFIPVCLSLSLVALWFIGKNALQRERLQRAVMSASAGLGISCGLVNLCNHFYDRPRPFEAMPQLVATAEKILYCPTDPSFPSNAAAIAIAVATGVWLRHRTMGIFLYFLALLMCFARVYAAVHYPSDIIGGAAIGVVSSYLALRVAIPLIEPLPTLILRLLRKLCLADQVSPLPLTFPFQRRYLSHFMEG